MPQRMYSTLDEYSNLLSKPRFGRGRAPRRGALPSGVVSATRPLAGRAKRTVGLTGTVSVQGSLKKGRTSSTPAPAPVGSAKTEMDRAVESREAKLVAETMSRAYGSALVFSGCVDDTSASSNGKIEHGARVGREGGQYREGQVAADVLRGRQAGSAMQSLGGVQVARAAISMAALGVPPGDVRRSAQKSFEPGKAMTGWVDAMVKCVGTTRLHRGPDATCDPSADEFELVDDMAAQFQDKVLPDICTGSGTCTLHLPWDARNGGLSPVDEGRCELVNPYVQGVDVVPAGPGAPIVAGPNEVPVGPGCTPQEPVLRKPDEQSGKCLEEGAGAIALPVENQVGGGTPVPTTQPGTNPVEGPGPVSSKVPSHIGEDLAPQSSETAAELQMPPPPSMFHAATNGVEVEKKGQENIANRNEASFVPSAKITSPPQACTAGDKVACGEVKVSTRSVDLAPNEADDEGKRPERSVDKEDGANISSPPRAAVLNISHEIGDKQPGSPSKPLASNSICPAENRVCAEMEEPSCSAKCSDEQLTSSVTGASLSREETAKPLLDGDGGVRENESIAPTKAELVTPHPAMNICTTGENKPVCVAKKDEEPVTLLGDDLKQSHDIAETECLGQIKTVSSPFGVPANCSDGEKKLEVGCGASDVEGSVLQSEQTPSKIEFGQGKEIIKLDDVDVAAPQKPLVSSTISAFKVDDAQWKKVAGPSSPSTLGVNLIASDPADIEEGEIPSLFFSKSTAAREWFFHGAQVSVSGGSEMRFRRVGCMTDRLFPVEENESLSHPSVGGSCPPSEPGEGEKEEAGRKSHAQAGRKSHTKVGKSKISKSKRQSRGDCRESTDTVRKQYQRRRQADELQAMLARASQGPLGPARSVANGSRTKRTSSLCVHGEESSKKRRLYRTAPNDMSWAENDDSDSDDVELQRTTRRSERFLGTGEKDDSVAQALGPGLPFVPSPSESRGRSRPRAVVFENGDYSNRQRKRRRGVDVNSRKNGADRRLPKPFSDAEGDELLARYLPPNSPSMHSMSSSSVESDREFLPHPDMPNVVASRKQKTLRRQTKGSGRRASPVGRMGKLGSQTAGRGPWKGADVDSIDRDGVDSDGVSVERLYSSLKGQLETTGADSLFRDEIEGQWEESPPVSGSDGEGAKGSLRTGARGDSSRKGSRLAGAGKHSLGRKSSKAGGSGKAKSSKKSGGEQRLGRGHRRKIQSTRLADEWKPEDEGYHSAEYDSDSMKDRRPPKRGRSRPRRQVKTDVPGSTAVRRSTRGGSEKLKAEVDERKANGKPKRSSPTRRKNGSIAKAKMQGTAGQSALAVNEPTVPVLSELQRQLLQNLCGDVNLDEIEGVRRLQLYRWATDAASFLGKHAFKEVELYSKPHKCEKHRATGEGGQCHVSSLVRLKQDGWQRVRRVVHSVGGGR